jgi:hypothetical protein
VKVADAFKAFIRRVAGQMLACLSPSQCYSLAFRVVGRLSPDQTRYLLYEVANIQRNHLCYELKQATGGIIQDGPFKGMKLPDLSSWGDGDYVPKLLGFYEAELHRIIYETLERSYDCFVNVGCAEGYYPVGYALLSKASQIFAFDASLEAQEVCKHCAEENGVSDRVRVGGLVDVVTLQNLLSRWKRPLLLMDCEGCEFHLMQQSLVPALEGADFIVECHNFAHPDIAKIIKERFRETHRITSISEGQRDPNRSAFLRHRNSLIRWLAVSERRPETMEWLYGISVRRQLEPAI